MRDSIKLRNGQQLRTVPVVVTDVVQGLGDAVDVRCRFGFRHDDRDAVDEEHDVGSDVGWGAVGEDEFVGDVEDVGFTWTRRAAGCFVLAAPTRQRRFSDP